MHAPVGDLAQEDRKKVGRGLERFHDRRDEAIELLVGRRRIRDDRGETFSDRREVIADNGGVQCPFVLKVVVDHRLVDAATAGDAIDGGGVEAAGAELGGGGGENAGAGARRGGGRRRSHCGALLTDRLVNTRRPSVSSRH